jgi:dGTPase
MKKYGGFDHNIQTLRIITRLENRYYNFNGLNLTYETLDGLVKHNGPVYDLTKFNTILGRNFFKNKIKFSNNTSLEAQIASISDDIAYNSHDLEDGLKSNLFKLNDLKNIPVLNKIINKHKKRLKSHSIDLIVRQIIRDIINEMVSDVIKTTKNNIKLNNITNLKDIYESRKNIVCFSNNMKNFDFKIKSFLKQKMYFHKSVNIKTNYGKKIIKNLFILIKKNPKKYISIKKYKNSSSERVICDYIAGMTDRYAINLYNKIK